MKLSQRKLVLLSAAGVWACTMAGPALAFIINPAVDPWLTTASDSRDGNGDPITFTWSIVPDGTNVPSSDFGNLGPSDLISFLDTTFGSGPGGADLMLRPWFHFFTDSFGRWSELSGATYMYVATDDGVDHSTADGVLGVRGDLRIGGANIDGPSNVLAFNYLPDNGDMVLDTADGAFFSNAANTHRALRDTVMHEHGHGFGLLHVNSTTDDLLMEPVIDTSFDGPQLDEVRGIQFHFGDANEKSNGGLGNDEFGLATSLGLIATGGTDSVGSDADVPGQFISPTATDFVSIANLGDTDFFSFSVSQPSDLNVLLTPRGGQFTQSQDGGTPTSFDASARSDLEFSVFDLNGTSLLASADATGQGGIESLVDLRLPVAGEYFVQIAGEQDTIQLYELELSVFSTADFDLDGDVDDADLAIWETAFGVNALGDADNDGNSNGSDFLLWQQQYTGPLGLVSSPTAVPEPSTGIILVFGIAALSFRRGFQGW